MNGRAISLLPALLAPCWVCGDAVSIGSPSDRFVRRDANKPRRGPWYTVTSDGGGHGPAARRPAAPGTRRDQFRTLDHQHERPAQLRRQQVPSRGYAMPTRRHATHSTDGGWIKVSPTCRRNGFALRARVAVSHRAPSRSVPAAAIRKDEILTGSDGSPGPGRRAAKPHLRIDIVMVFNVIF